MIISRSASPEEKSEYLRQYRAANKEALRIKAKARQEAKKDEYRAARALKAEKYRDHNRQYQTDNKEEIAERKSLKWRSDPDFYKSRDKRYRDNAKISGWARRTIVRARRRAYDIGLEFNLTIDDVTLPTHCPVLGIKLEVRGGRNSPSIDRIDNSKGYLKGNVIIVSMRANSMKSDATVDELRRVADFYEKLTQATLQSEIGQ